jgi:hypothetical protein
MNNASEQRLAIAKRNAVTYLANPKVTAVGVSGSDITLLSREYLSYA